MTPSIVPPLPLPLLFASVMLSFGLLVSTALAAAIKAALFRARTGAYGTLVRGALIGVAIALGVLFALLYSGANLLDGFLGDLLWNGAALVFVSALAGLSFTARRLLVRTTRAP